MKYEQATAHFMQRMQEAGIPFRQHVPMAEKTSLKVGGAAQIWIEADSPQTIAFVRSTARALDLPFQTVGNGSNLLVRDGGISGITLHIGDGMSAIAIDGDTLYAAAGAKLTQAALAAQAAGLGGMEALAGIPGTIGGALYMNAGAYGTEIGQLVQSVDILDETGTQRTLSPSEMAFAYRHSAMMENNWIAMGVRLALQKADPEEISQKIREYAKARREKQPLNLPSAGSFFKRPENGFAAALIDQAGLKGESVGGAQVSEKHVGFLVNTGGATAQDFLSLMKIVQARVQEASGVLLKAEVQIIGCDTYC